MKMTAQIRTPALVVVTLSSMLAMPMAASSQDEKDVQKIEVDLGDYRFTPDKISIVAGKPVELVLTNRDTFTPHSFVLTAPEAGMDMKVNVSAGKSASVSLGSSVPGTYTFFCDNKLLFLKSHRERGMEGELVVKGASE